MKATVCIKDCFAVSDTQIQVAFHVSLSNGQLYQASENVTPSPSATALNNAIKSSVIASAVSYGGAGLQASDVTIFGGVS